MKKFSFGDEVVVNDTAPITERGLRGRVVKTDGDGGVRIVNSRSGGGWYPESELSLVDTVDTPPQPDLAQQLADALERAERAEAALRLIAEQEPVERPTLSKYLRSDDCMIHIGRWDIAQLARMKLRELEKAVGDE